MTIGYTNPGYPVVRNILNVVGGVDYRRVRPYGSLLVRMLPNVILKKCGTTLLNSYIGGIGDRKVDLMHFFNIVGIGTRGVPYVTTFETEIPRFNITLNGQNVSGGGGKLCA